MIKLFSIPNYKIDTADFDHLLHGKVVTEFEEAIAEYTGAKYAVTFNSATSAIYTIYKHIFPGKVVTVPSILPHVVANAIINAGGKVRFWDYIDWVGEGYTLSKISDNCMIFDSAHSVERGMCLPIKCLSYIVILSHYPTKVVGSCDGGTILTNDKSLAEQLRSLSMNGANGGINSWERRLERVGEKLYMNSLQAHIALQNLKRLGEKKERLHEIREQYNKAFELQNTSDHLYRISVEDNLTFIDQAKESGIACGIHYQPLHLHPLYRNEQELPLSEKEGATTVSIPFHEELSKQDIQKVIEFVKQHD